MGRRQRLETRLAKEDGEEDDRFGESHSDNRLNEHLSSCFWVTTYRLTRLKTNEANAKRNCESCCCDVNLSCDFCEDIEHNVYSLSFVLVVFCVVHDLLRDPERGKCDKLVCFFVVVGHETNVNRDKECEDKGLNNTH